MSKVLREAIVQIKIKNVFNKYRTEGSFKLQK